VQCSVWPRMLGCLLLTQTHPSAGMFLSLLQGLISLGAWVPRSNPPLDSQELAVDSQDLAVRTGGCRVGMLDAGCPSLLPWHVPWTCGRQELTVRTGGRRMGVLDAGCLAGGRSSLLLRRLPRTKTITTLRERVGSARRVAMCPTSRRVTNPQGAGLAPSEPHSGIFRSAAPIRAHAPLADYANPIREDGPLSSARHAVICSLGSANTVGEIVQDASSVRRKFWPDFRGEAARRRSSTCTNRARVPTRPASARAW
jgi:hypothetical protein